MYVRVKVEFVDIPAVASSCDLIGRDGTGGRRCFMTKEIYCED